MVKNERTGFVDRLIELIARKRHAQRERVPALRPRPEPGGAVDVRAQRDDAVDRVDEGSGDPAFRAQDSLSTVESRIDAGDQAIDEQGAPDGDGVPAFDVEEFAAHHRAHLMHEAEELGGPPGAADRLIDGVLQDVEARVRLGEFAPEQAFDVALTLARNRVLHAILEGPAVEPDAIEPDAIELDPVEPGPVEPERPRDRASGLAEDRGARWQADIATRDEPATEVDTTHAPAHAAGVSVPHRADVSPAAGNLAASGVEQAAASNRQPTSRKLGIDTPAIEADAAEYNAVETDAVEAERPDDRASGLAEDRGAFWHADIATRDNPPPEIATTHAPANVAGASGRHRADVSRARGNLRPSGVAQAAASNRQPTGRKLGIDERASAVEHWRLTDMLAPIEEETSRRGRWMRAGVAVSALFFALVASVILFDPFVLAERSVDRQAPEPAAPEPLRPDTRIVNASPSAGTPASPSEAQPVRAIEDRMARRRQEPDTATKLAALSAVETRQPVARAPSPVVAPVQQAPARAAPQSPLFNEDAFRPADVPEPTAPSPASDAAPDARVGSAEEGAGGTAVETAGGTAGEQAGDPSDVPDLAPLDAGEEALGSQLRSQLERAKRQALQDVLRLAAIERAERTVAETEAVPDAQATAAVSPGVEPDASVASGGAPERPLAQAALARGMEAIETTLADGASASGSSASPSASVSASARQEPDAAAARDASAGTALAADVSADRDAASVDAPAPVEGGRAEPPRVVVYHHDDPREAARAARLADALRAGGYAPVALRAVARPVENAVVRAEDRDLNAPEKIADFFDSWLNTQGFSRRQVTLTRLQPDDDAFGDIEVWLPTPG